MKLLFKRICTALAFSSFGILCMLGNLFFIPIALLGLNRYKKVENFSRDLIFWAWRIFIGLLLLYGSVNAKFLDIKNLANKNSAIIIANHPSLLDIVLLLSHIKRANCIVKASLAKNIFLFAAIRAANYILNTENEQMLKLSQTALKNGENLIIFPEATRTKDTICMQKGAFYIAVNFAQELIALYIKMSPKSLKKGQAWYDTPKATLKYEIGILESIDLKEFESNRANPIRVRLLLKNIQSLYDKEQL